MSGRDALEARGLDEGPLFGWSLGVTRGHVTWTAGILIAVFVAVLLGRVVLDAAAAASRVDELRAANAALRAEVDALAAERELVTSPIFIEVAGRGQGYGDPAERAFGLAPGAPAPEPLVEDPPSTDAAASPVGAWLTLLFGP